MVNLQSVLDVTGTRVSYPFLFTFLGAKSLTRRGQSLRHRPHLHQWSDYDGRPIALVALFQKGRLRDDSLRLLRALRDKGCYVMAVNTLRLEEPEALRDLCDLYIERFNFGRDFGSYKCGFDHIYAKGWDARCDRLLMINDSVFCASRALPAFVDALFDTPHEVLGSTENHEIAHHLGSFCISMSGDVLRSAALRQFWRKYRNSDVRPLVIYAGEQGLSKALKRAVRTLSGVRTLFGARDYLQRLETSDSFVDTAIRLSRHSDLTGWKRFSPSVVLDALRDRHLVRTLDLPRDARVQIDQDRMRDRIVVASLSDLSRLADATLSEDQSVDTAAVRNATVAHLTEVFMAGSQIHQNAAILLHMGLPIVKLDGLYRGMFSIRDIQLLTEQLPGDESEALRHLLMERPYGGDTLLGWRRLAFMRGLI